MNNVEIVEKLKKILKRSEDLHDSIMLLIKELEGQSGPLQNNDRALINDDVINELTKKSHR